MPNIDSLLRDHVTLQVESIDRIYLNGYLPGLQRSGQLAYFLTTHRKNPIASPALLGQMTRRFVEAIYAFAERGGIPIVEFKLGERKDDVAKARLARFRGKEGVVFIGVAQEADRAFRSVKRRGRGGGVSFDFYRGKVFVNHYYFYILLRTETVINNPDDVGCRRGLSNLGYLRTIGRNINHRLLALERTSHNCIISSSRTFQSVVLPSDADGQHAPGLRFGDPRVMAALAALCLFLPTPDGFTNRMLRERVAALHNPSPKPYSPPRMTYDLRRLRLKGLIQRLPAKHRYVLTPVGRRVALFFSKTYARILRPGFARLDPDLAPNPADPLADAWRRLDVAVDWLIREAKIAA